GNRTTSIGGGHNRKIGTDDRAMSGGNFTETIGGAVLETSQKNNLVQAELESTLDVGGSSFEIAKAGKMESTVKERTETITGLSFLKAEGNIASRIGELRVTTGDSSLSVTAEKEVVIVGIEELDTLSATGLFAGDKITLRVGSSEVSLKDGKIS